MVRRQLCKIRVAVQRHQPQFIFFLFKFQMYLFVFVCFLLIPPGIDLQNNTIRFPKAYAHAYGFFNESLKL
jgi:hypothetical protein